MEISYAILSLLSFIGILFKDIALAGVYGANTTTDAFFCVSQLFFILFAVLGAVGGPFHKTTVLIISDITNRPKQDIKNLLNSFLTASGIVSLLLSVCAFVFAGNIADTLITGSNLQLKQILVSQLHIMSPALFIGGITGILSGVFNTYGKFLTVVSGSSIMSVVFITIILIFGKPGISYIPAYAFMFGAVALFIFQLATFLSLGLGYKPQLNFSHPKVIVIKKMFFPALFAFTLGNLYILVDIYFAAGTFSRNFMVFNYKPGWSEFCYANSIFLFVCTIAMSALSTLTFNELKNTTQEIYLRLLSNYYNKILDFIFFIALPITAFMAFFARDIVKLVYERGQFSQDNTFAVAGLLIILSIAILPFLIKTIIIKLYYSFNSMKVPCFIAIFGLLLKGSLNYLLIKVFNMGINAIAVSTLLVMTIEAAALAVFIRNKLRTDYEGLIYMTIQIFSVTLLTGLFIFAGNFFFAKYMPVGDAFLSLRLLIILLAGFVLYFLLSLPVKVYAAQIILNNIKNMKPFVVFNHEIEEFKALINNQNKDYECLYKELVEEKNKSESLLLNILPGEVAEELKETGKVKPVHYDCASVMFTDFQGFTKISKELSNEELITELDSCYKFFDIICEKYNLEKIKTIGDSYMCVGGVPSQNKTHAIDCVLAAFCFLIYMEKVRIMKQRANLPYFNIRIGIHTGSVIAGVIGTNKSSYDVWGDTVNLASRMESGGEPRKINISESTYELIKDYFDCTYRGEQEAKNAGKVGMYFVNRLKPEFADPAKKVLPNEKFMKIYNEIKNSSVLK